MVEFFKSLGRKNDKKNLDESKITEKKSETKSMISKDVSAILEKGQELVTQNKLNEALTYYQSVLDEFPQNAIIFEKIGDVFKGLGKFEDAIKYYDKALEIEPNNLVLLMNSKGRLLFDLERFEELVECCKIGLRIDPKNVHVLNTMGGALSEVKTDEAIRYLDRSLEIEPENIMALMGKGACYSNMERYDEAKKFFEKVLELEPNHPVAIYQMADVHLKGHPELSETPEFKELRKWRDDFSKKFPQKKISK